MGEWKELVKRIIAFFNTSQIEHTSVNMFCRVNDNHSTKNTLTHIRNCTFFPMNSFADICRQTTTIHVFHYNLDGDCEVVHASDKMRMIE